MKYEEVDRILESLKSLKKSWNLKNIVEWGIEYLRISVAAIPYAINGMFAVQATDLHSCHLVSVRGQMDPGFLCIC